MNILYITVSFESVQRHIFTTMKRKKQEFGVFLYGIKRIKEINGLPNEVSFFNPKWKMSLGPLFYLSHMRVIATKCMERINCDKTDIMHGNMAFRDGILCRIISRKKGIPYIVSFRDTDFEVYYKWKLPWIRSACYNVLKDAKCIIFLSKPYMNKLLSVIPKRIRLLVREKSVVVPNGIDDFFIENRGIVKIVNSKVINIISVGKICKRKNQETSIKGVQILRSLGYDCRLTLVGRIEDEKYYRLIKANGFVRHIDESTKENVIEYMRESDILIVPSRTETFGLVYAEAMSQGLPIIYTRGQGFDGQFEEGYVGFSVDCEDPSEIASRVIDILNSYSTISKNCIEESARYNWSSIIDEFLEIYNCALCE